MWFIMFLLAEEQFQLKQVSVGIFFCFHVFILPIPRYTEVYQSSSNPSSLPFNCLNPLVVVSLLMIINYDHGDNDDNCDDDYDDADDDSRK